MAARVRCRVRDQAGLEVTAVAAFAAGEMKSERQALEINLQVNFVALVRRVLSKSRSIGGSGS